MINVQQAIQKLRDGNAHFAQDKLERKNQGANKRRELINRQEPWAIVLCCADSRVVPDLIFDVGIGELFVIRVAGNIANISTIASIEYAVAHIHTPVIVVLGHENCGAVTAALQKKDYGPNINHLLSHIQPAIVMANDKSVNAVARQNALLTAGKLINRSEIIGNAVEQNTLEIVPAYYHLDSGKVDFYMEA
jgi:carbonic anhydrase